MQNVKISQIQMWLLGSACLIASLPLQAEGDSCRYNMAGMIVDVDTEEPLPYVSVRVLGTDKATLTDSSGTFEFTELCTEAHTLVCSYTGYCDTTCASHHDHGGILHIHMRARLSQLEEILIETGPSQIAGTQSLAQRQLSNADLAQAPHQTLGDVLSTVEGVNTVSAGPNVQLPVIHGLYGNRILILNQGVKHGFQNWGQDHAPEIDVANAKRITVIKGAAGVRFGPEALGGVVIVEGNPLHLNEPFSAQVGTGFQSNGRGYVGNVNLGQGYRRWSYHVSGNYTHIGDRHTPDYSLTNTGKRELALRAGLRYHLPQWDFQLRYSVVDQNLALLRSSVASSGNLFARSINEPRPLIIRPFSYDIAAPNQLVRHHLVKGDITWWYTPDANLTLRLSRQLNQREEYDVRRSVDLPILDLDLITNDIQLEWTHPDWWKLNGLVGLQLFYQNNDNNPGTNTTAVIPNYNTTRISAFAVESLETGAHTFEIGLRGDYEYNNIRGRKQSQEIFRDEYQFVNWTASLGYLLRLSDRITFRSNVGSAWRIPNMAELYIFGQHGFKTSYGLLRYYENEEGDFRTNRVTEMSAGTVAPEIGYKWVNEWQVEQGKGRYTLTAYVHYLQNYVFDRPFGVLGTIRGPMPGFIYDQEDVLFCGIDATWEQQWHRQLRGRFSASYLWSQNINQPPASLSYALVYEAKSSKHFDGMRLHLTPQYIFEQWQAPPTISPDRLIDGSEEITIDSDIFDFKDAPEGFFLLNLGIQGDIGPFHLALDVRNALNQRYRSYLNEMRYFADEPGLNVLISLSYRLGGSSD